MNKIYIILLLTILSSFRLFASDFSIEDRHLVELFNAQQQNNRAWAANENFLETGELQFDISRSMLFPQIDAKITGAGSNSFLNRTPAELDDIELRNNYIISAVPELSISQLLPSAGILTGSITDTFSGSGLKESNSILQPAKETELSNQIDVTLGFSQPLFLGGAYKASLTQINESRNINYINYIDNRNALIYAAVVDYYTLIQSAYQKDLVSKRLETNVQYEKRMIREYELGMWTKAQLNSATAVRLQSEADLLKAQQTLNSAKKRISTLYGIEIATEDLNSEISEFTFNMSDEDSIKSELLTNNPDILKSLKSIAIANSEIVIQQKNAAPSLTAGGSYLISDGLENTSFTDNLSFSIGLSFSLADGKSSSKTIELRQKESEQLKNNYENQQKQILSELQTLIDNIEVSLKLTEIYILQEEAASFDYEKGLKELELGSISQKELLELQIDLENTQLTLLLNKIDYNLTVLRIYRLLGNDLILLTRTRTGA